MISHNTCFIYGYIWREVFVSNNTYKLHICFTPCKKKEKSSITCNSKLLHVLHLQSWYLTNFEIEINLRAAAQFPFLLASFSGT